MCQGCCTQEAQGPQGTGTALWEGVRESYYQCCAWNLCATRLQRWLQFLMSCRCSLSKIQNNMFIGEILSIQWMAFRFFHWSVQSSSMLRSGLMLPGDCPYLQAITARFKAETSRKRTRDEYDLTKRILCCTGQCVTKCPRGRMNQFQFY